MRGREARPRRGAPRRAVIAEAAREVDVAAERPALRGAGGYRIGKFLAAIAFLCGIASFARSTAFDVRFAAVDGNRVLTAGEVLLRAGIGRGTPIFTVNAEKIRRRLRQDPRVAGTSVTVQLPDRVTIHVRERAAVAALRMPDGYVLLGRDGVAIVPAGTPGPLPTLTADRLDLPAVETGAVVPSADVRLGAEIAGSLPEDLRPEVAGIRIDQGGEVVLYTRDQIAVRVGGPPGVGDRVARVPAVLAAVRARHMRVEYVDVRFPGSIIVRPVGGSAVGPKAVSSRP